MLILETLEIKFILEMLRVLWILYMSPENEDKVGVLELFSHYQIFMCLTPNTVHDFIFVRHFFMIAK